jgi:hypothetical protein
MRASSHKPTHFHARNGCATVWKRWGAGGLTVWEEGLSVDIAVMVWSFRGLQEINLGAANCYAYYGLW